jgi:hypothetical protein
MARACRYVTWFDSSAKWLRLSVHMSLTPSSRTAKNLASGLSPRQSKPSMTSISVYPCPAMYPT